MYIQELGIDLINKWQRAEELQCKSPGHCGQTLDSKSAGQTSNDQRSRDMNPNNPAYQAVLDNRSQQMDPISSKYQGGHGKGSKK